jgi:putative ABC transport system permease protein
MADDDYLEAFGLSLLDGRNFSKKFNDHWKSAFVNETAMKLLGFSHPGEIIGQKIYLWDNVVEIVGVVQDYHQESLRKRVDQLIFVCDTEAQTYYSIKINTKSSVDEIVSRAKTVYGTAFPGNPFHFFFMDDHFNRQYRADRQFGEIVGLFTVVSLVIACLGLFGLSSYAVVQRTKEIGIRKVLGASAAQISALLSKEFALIVILAILIGWATAYWVVDQWLSEFAYRITPGFTMYLVPGLAIFIVTLLTVLFQAIRAALVDPVKSLRIE